MSLPITSKKHFAITFAKELPPYFTKPEVDQILANLWQKQKLRDYLLVLLLWQTGARISELLSVKVSDIDFFNATIKLQTLKRKFRTERVLPLKPQTLGILALYINQFGLQRDNRIFKISRQQAFRIVKKAVLEVFPGDTKRAHPHVLRHSFAIYALSSGIPITVVRSWLGHRNITSTLIYTQALAQDTRRFFEMVEF
ncbi:MAG: tyrosine-type recombinase/integrase [Caldimicrobium sp.]|nr:tyrosine-type recombinase/integrase [Caldimicrobium sp.]